MEKKHFIFHIRVITVSEFYVLVFIYQLKWNWGEKAEAIPINCFREFRLVVVLFSFFFFSAFK